MAAEPSSSTTGANLVKAGALVLPPGAIAVLELGFQVDLPTPLVVTIVSVYCVMALGFAFAGDVYKALIVRWTPLAADAADGAIRRRLSTYESRIRAYTIAAYGHIDTQGLSTLGTDTLTLDEVFVNLHLDSSSIHNLSADPLMYGSSRRDLHASIWYWYQKARENRTALVVIGPPGSGKTTLMRYVASTVAGRKRRSSQLKLPSRLPVFISLRDYRANFTADAPLELIAIVRHELKLVVGKEPPEFIEKALDRGDLLVIFDGMDELAEADARRLAANWISHQQYIYPKLDVIVTSRPAGYKENPLSNAAVVQVSRFTDQQIESFVKGWYAATALRSIPSRPDSAALIGRKGYVDLIGKLSDNPRLQELATNPLLLTMICNVHHYRGALPGSRLELYRELCDVLLGKRHAARGIPVTLSLSQRLTLLQELAYFLMTQRRRDWTVADAEMVLRPILRGIDSALQVADLLSVIEASSGMVIQREEGVHSFAHLTFQEYLASVHMREQEGVDLTAVNVGDPWWNETLLLYSAQGDASVLIDACLNAAGRDLSVLSLAIGCLREARTVSLDIREMLDQVMRPADIATDRSARVLAGTVRVYLREREFRRFDSGAFLCPNPVSRSEFMLFLEEQEDPRIFMPDYWDQVDDGYLRPDAPIAGVRPLVAEKFAQWFTQKISGEYKYRLPFWSEISSDFRLSGESNANQMVAHVLVVKDVELPADNSDVPYASRLLRRLDTRDPIINLLKLLSEDAKQVYEVDLGFDVRLAQSSFSYVRWIDEDPRCHIIFGESLYLTDLVDLDSLSVRAIDLADDIKVFIELVQSPGNKLGQANLAVLTLGKASMALAAYTGAVSRRFDLVQSPGEANKIFLSARVAALILTNLVDRNAIALLRALDGVSLAEDFSYAKELQAATTMMTKLLSRSARIYSELAMLELWANGVLAPAGAIVLARSNSAEAPDEE